MPNKPAKVGRLAVVVVVLEILVIPLLGLGHPDYLVGSCPMREADPEPRKGCLVGRHQSWPPA